ncbi:hypothetical protein ALI144C_06875 [Actinosynnema sp. ALI-1.44]|uniref:hypothetical protein n=1 Tax=Actinosynnema sp. ALI-1.44 TaxID=1933779 RepID=UPI00097CA2F7|nr:hypothetical protein [Actinosynnema sp. ALI-1.44]ONI88178.1 hypothetical protein ALI144C_06875 [Actinosynnema sp. ALI-1.44]
MEGACAEFGRQALHVEGVEYIVRLAVLDQRGPHRLEVLRRDPARSATEHHRRARSGAEDLAG